MRKVLKVIRNILIVAIILVAIDFGIGFLAPYKALKVTAGDSYYFERKNCLTYMYTNDTSNPALNAEKKCLFSGTAYTIIGFMSKTTNIELINTLGKTDDAAAAATGNSLSVVTSDEHTYNLKASGLEDDLSSKLSTMKTIVKFSPRIQLEKVPAPAPKLYNLQ